MGKSALKSLLVIFKIVGLCNSVPPEPVPKNLPLLAWQAIHFAFIIAYCIAIFIYQNEIFSPEFLLTKLTDVFQMLIPLATYAVTMVMLVIRYKSQRKFWLLVMEVRSKFFTLRSDVLVLLNEKLRRFRMELILLQAACNINELVIIYKIYLSFETTPEIEIPSLRAWFISRLLLLIPYNFGRMTFLFHVFLIQFIEQFSEILVDELHYLGTVSKRKRGMRSPGSELVKKLVLLKMIHFRIVKLNRYLNKIFGLSHAINMLAWFIIMATCWYFISSNLKYWEQSTHFFMTLSASFAPMGIVIYVCLKFNMVEQTIGQIVHELHRIDTVGNPALAHIRLLFAHQIEQQSIKASAMGFFNINNGFLKDITAVTVSYIVILVQFMPDSLSPWSKHDEQGFFLWRFNNL